MGGISQSETQDGEYESFKEVFYETVAALGLHHRLEAVEPQNESDSAILANAA